MTFNKREKRQIRLFKEIKKQVERDEHRISHLKEKIEDLKDTIVRLVDEFVLE